MFQRDKYARSIRTYTKFVVNYQYIDEYYERYLKKIPTLENQLFIYFKNKINIFY